jgi:hypothetical protein
VGDVVFIGILVAFFGLAVLLVHGCERIIGPAEQGENPSRAVPAPETGVAA